MHLLPARAGRGRALAGVLALSLPLLAAAASAADVPAAATVPAPLPSSVKVGALTVASSFVSSTGWVKPGTSYPTRVLVTNPGPAVKNLKVVLAPLKGMTFTAARAPLGSVQRTAAGVIWTLGSVPKGTTALVLTGRAATLVQEPTVVWRDISAVAQVSLNGGTTRKVAAHGPKVIPPTGGFETARYGDRPFPVVPVDYAGAGEKHTADHPATTLDGVLNGPANPGSTFNLYQEMSYGQLFPKASIPSAAIGDKAASPSDGLVFTTLDPTKITTCTGAQTGSNPLTGVPTAAYTDRIVDGWYQLPGLRNYYGADANGSAVVGSLAGVGALQSIDSGCGPAAKAAYDAAVVADPDIDYNDFDTDKDGVVDFFEVVFQGCGGNGASQLSVAAGCPVDLPYDNIWPHSSSLENSYSDPATGLTGYISKDRLRDLEGNLLFYTDSTYTKTTRATTTFPAFVRVGPYNVNPETAIDFASVISHEYGHSLGLPDYYSTGSRSTYGDFTLMATDQSQDMDVIGKKELGWIVPGVLPRTGTRAVKGWKDSKVDTGKITWRTPTGSTYTLTAGTDHGIHNGQAYVATLPGRELISAAEFATGASGKRAWYSQQGNDFGCVPTGGHNLDVVIPGIGDLPAGSTVTVSVKSYWDIEWDFDYGFVMTGRPDSAGAYSYASVPSANGFTTPATQNPNQNACQSAYGNGLTGSSGSYAAGQPAVDRVTGDYRDADTGFVADRFDISSLAGVDGGVLRFSYATDPGLARTGWLIDDLVVTATTPSGATTLLSTDFESDGGADDPRFYPGGCKEDLTTSGGVCTQGWANVAAGTPSELEHAYLLEMRDRSGFDFDGRGEADRGGATFEPGLLLTYTDEAHGYGNVGTDDPPAQSPLDSTPEALSATPELGDATFTAAAGRSTFTDAPATPHIDNYSEPGAGGAQPWTFDDDCLSFQVLRLAGNTANAADKRDLVGDVTFTTRSGCGPFSYGIR